MQKIKVCHIITKLELGGAQQNTLYTVSHLDNEKFIPVLISGTGGILDSEASKLSGVKTYFIPSLKRSVNPLNDFLSFIQIFLKLLKEKPDIVHTHSSKAGILGRWAAFFARTPLIIHTFHGFGFNDSQKSFVKNIFIFLEKVTDKITDKFIAVTSEDINKGLANHIGSAQKYIIIRSGIEISKFKNTNIDSSSKRKELGLNPDDKVITTIGPFKPQKNIADFILVAKAVLEEYKSCKFLVVGDGELREKLKSEIINLKLEKTVILLGWRKDINEILKVTDIFVLTSLWEGLPRSILEAMSSKIPVVANAVDGVKEIIKDTITGFLVKPHDIQQMTNRLLFLLNNPEKAVEMGTKAMDFIDKQYDIDVMVKQQEALYLDKTHLFK